MGHAWQEPQACPSCGTLLRIFTGRVLRNIRQAHAPGAAAFPFGVSPWVASEISLR